MTSRVPHAKKKVSPEIKRLVEEIRQEREKSRVLKQSVSEWETTHEQWGRQGEESGEEEETGQEQPLSEQDQVWKTRYETQVDVNTHLQSQISGLRNKIGEKKNELQSEGGLKKLTQSDLKKKIIQLQRQKNNRDSQMKDLEYRIDREAELYHKANEKKKTLYFDIKRNPKPDSAKAAERGNPAPAIRRGTLAKGSYVRKLLERKSQKTVHHGSQTQLGIGTKPGPAGTKPGPAGTKPGPAVSTKNGAMSMTLRGQRGTAEDGGETSGVKPRRTHPRKLPALEVYHVTADTEPVHVEAERAQIKKR